MLITTELLKEHGACKEQRELFTRWLGRRKDCELTAKNMKSAVRKGLDVGWLFGTVVTEPDQKTRQAACTDPDAALSYARYVDRAPRQDTRQAACQDPRTAYHYARTVDKKKRDDTMEAVRDDPLYRWLYRRFVLDWPMEEC